MSEGTPGHGPDADSRTENGDGQASTNGRPAVPPVRYGPRNGAPANGSNGRGATGRTAAGPSTPQQYRTPQAPRTPPKTGADAPAPNGAGAATPNGSGANGGTNGNGSNGSHVAGPSSYTRPRPSGSAPRPEPSQQERQVADARIAAAARNASASKVRGGSALSGRTAATPDRGSADRGTTATPADDTAVIPAVPAPTEAPAAPAEETSTPDKGRTVFGRRRSRGGAKGPEEAPQPGAAQEVAVPKDATTKDATATTVESPKAGSAVAAAGAAAVTSETKPTDEATGSESRTESATNAPATEESAPQERTLTWRDRLGLAPKEPKPQPVQVPETGPGIPTGAAAAAVAASVAAGTAPPETKASPTGPTTAPQPVSPYSRVTPSSPVPAVSPDTEIIPAVEAGAVSPAAPAAAATTQALVTAKPKVGAARRTRKARLRLSRVDPWSVMKTALLFSIAAGIILVVATYGVWSVLNASGLFDAVNDMVKSVVSTPGDTTPFRIEEYVNTQKIIGVAALIAVVDVLIFTALATLGSFLYNLAATVLGGLEVTLAED
ncbi:hypothetical protein GCM10022197_23440 [Microlunatus spumicola]|uniref:DUF3566 domain-containing protein n=1 Tax=Microlunatus spumicola TaxID=81499 RepID=A0ABP6XGN9_9ACTN